METNDLFGNPVTFKHCVTEDLLTHFEPIEHWITDIPKVEFLQRMKACIDENMAFALDDDSAFLYMYPVRTEGMIGPTVHYAGIAIYGGPDQVKFLALLKGIFEDLHPTIARVDFKLHPGKALGEYKSLLHTKSLERFGTEMDHVFIRTDELQKKLRSLYYSRGLK